MFVSKNGGGNDTWLTNTDQVFGYQVVNGTASGFGGSLSATAYLLSTDYVSFGFWFDSGNITYTNTTRILATMTLIQKTA